MSTVIALLMLLGLGCLVVGGVMPLAQFIGNGPDVTVVSYEINVPWEVNFSQGHFAETTIDGKKSIAFYLNGEKYPVLGLFSLKESPYWYSTQNMSYKDNKLEVVWTRERGKTIWAGVGFLIVGAALLTVSAVLWRKQIKS